VEHKGAVSRGGATQNVLILDDTAFDTLDATENRDFYRDV
jgi:hypothetical protein